jgi:predicted nucleic acid-binding protein
VAEPRALVLDASVSVKWLMRDEPHAAVAADLLRRSDTGDVILVAPQQIEVETVAAIRKAVINRRLNAQEGNDRVEAWMDDILPRFVQFPNGAVLEQAYVRALQFGVSLFDALYLELAATLQIDYVGADERLLRSTASSLPFLKGLSSFTL